MTEAGAKVIQVEPPKAPYQMKELGFSDEYIDEMYAAGETRTMDSKETAVYWNLKEWNFFWREDQAERLGL